MQVSSECITHAVYLPNTIRSSCVHGRTQPTPPPLLSQTDTDGSKHGVYLLRLLRGSQRPCWLLVVAGLALPWACCDCGCVWDFFLEAHLSLLLFLFSVGLVWGGSSLVVRYLRSSEQGRLCGFCCWQMLFALLPHEFSVLKTRHKES